MRVLILLAFVGLVRADELTQKMISRLQEEADAFQRFAPQIIGKETLRQKVLKPLARFRPRVGEAARVAAEPQWKEREIVSEYAFAALGGDEAELHEMRQVVMVDGKRIEDPKKAQDALARIITSSDIERKRQLLKDFEKYGLSGAVTDFGQLILLFHPRNIPRYEFSQRGVEILGNVQTFVFAYKQIDGPEAVTVFDSSHQDRASNLKAEGQIWVRADNFLPVRISIAVNRGQDKSSIREEAIVNYSMSRYGDLLPTTTDHREIAGGQTTAENHFEYTDFRKFGAASDISFETRK